MTILLIVAALILAGLLFAHFFYASRFTAITDALVGQLLASQSGPMPVASLPEIVRTFAIRNGGMAGGPLAVKMVQSAEMRMSPAAAFFHLDATQTTGSKTPGFVWQASGFMAKVLPIRIVDSFVAERGWLEARIAGSIPVASACGPDIDKGEAMRFLAELAWNPDAFFNMAGLAWRQIDDLTVEVTMQTNGGAARVRLLFDAAGDITGIEADDRPQGKGKASKPMRWIGRFSGYAQSGHYRWPRHGEIAWDRPEGEFVYWRGDILSVEPVHG